jgi:hypothetical protein
MAPQSRKNANTPGRRWLASRLVARRQCKKKSGPKAGKNLQQQAQRLAGTSQCGEKFIMYEINYKM